MLPSRLFFNTRCKKEAGARNNHATSPTRQSQCHMTFGRQFRTEPILDCNLSTMGQGAPAAAWNLTLSLQRSSLLPVSETRSNPTYACQKWFL
jgi:hypothetical protein